MASFIEEFYSQGHYMQVAYQGSAYQLHYRDDGPQHAPHVYVLLAGLSLPWFDWAQVAELLAQDSRVITYDRLGAGLSDLPTGVATLEGECEVLLQLLDHLHVKNAVIVGHSMAGFIVETFARLHPERCERIVLLDASIEEEMTGEAHEVDQLLNAGASWALRAGQGAVALAWVRTLVAASRVIAKPSVGQLLLDARAHLAVMSRHSALAGALRENHSYLLWASQAAAVRRSLPALGPVASLVLATGVRPLPRKGRRAERGRAFARRLAPTATGVAVIEIAATHVAMRSNPVATARAIAYVPRAAQER